MYNSDCVVLSFDSSVEISNSLKCWLEEIRGIVVFFHFLELNLVKINTALPLIVWKYKYLVTCS